MNTQIISFMSVLDKYLLYAETVHQYTRLNKEDQKIIAPYVENLKRAWQEDLKALKSRQYIPDHVKVLANTGYSQ